MPHNPEQPDLVESDFLRGAAEIAAFLRSLGLTDVDEKEVYYFHRSRKLSLGKFGKQLIGSRSRLRRDLQRAAKTLGTA
jgi:hypothetical protein